MKVTQSQINDCAKLMKERTKAWEKYIQNRTFAARAAVDKLDEKIEKIPNAVIDEVYIQGLH